MGLAMKFIIKQRIFSFADSFVIYDENNRPAYQVEGKLFTFGNKLRIYDMNNQEQVYIEQKLFKLLPEYHLFEKGQRVAIVKKEFTFFKPRFNITATSGNYTVEGNPFAYNFRIVQDGRVVARVDKAFFAFKDTYAVDIEPGADEGLLLAMCIVIDQTLHDNNHNNN